MFSTENQQKSGIVAIAGRPNSGKSTLLNRIVGANLSIVTPKAQTTREQLKGLLTTREGQIVFVDTPGIHKAKAGGINEYMVHEATAALQDPDVIWFLVDPESNIKKEIVVLDAIQSSLRATKQKPIVFLVLNKVDVAVKTPERRKKFADLKARILEEAEIRSVAFEEILEVSGRYGQGVNQLVMNTWNHLPLGPVLYPDEDALSDRPVRYFVAEGIRKQLFLKLGQEVPYSCAVKVESFDESRKPAHVEASIVVEKESQKGIVIGNKGTKIREIGTAAREELEHFLDQRLYLGLKVKVLKDWSKDSDQLENLGYHVPRA